MCVISNHFDNDRVWVCSGDVHYTPLIVVLNGISKSCDDPRLHVLRMCWSPEMHRVRISRVKIWRQLWIVDRILNNIVRYSSLGMSDSGLLLELGSSHCQGQCELLIIGSSVQVWLQFSIITPFLLDSSSPESLLCSLNSATNSLRSSCSCLSGFQTFRPLSGHPHDHDINRK